MALAPGALAHSAARLEELRFNSVRNARSTALVTQSLRIARLFLTSRAVWGTPWPSEGTEASPQRQE